MFRYGMSDGVALEQARVWSTPPKRTFRSTDGPWRRRGCHSTSCWAKRRGERTARGLDCAC
ncbi:MAG: hypothetical protein ACLRSE_11255 [Alistipes finegoldii]